METNEKVVVVGDGPTGLSAALMLAKNGFRVDVLGADATATRKAMLHNHLGLDGLPGPDFVDRARDHAEQYGARLHKTKVTGIDLGERLRVSTEGESYDADYLVLATGFDRRLVDTLDIETTDTGVRVDRDGRTSHARVYAGGALTRGPKSQVATGVGDGAAIAVDIMSRVAGKPTHDYDVYKPPKQQTQA